MAAENTNDGYLCTYQGCGKTFTLKQHLTRHLLIHESPKLSCDKCPKQFRRHENLKRHKTKGGQQQQQQPSLHCTFEGCTRSFNQKRNLDRRALIHSLDRFSCRICNTVFTRKDNLKRHIYANNCMQKSAGSSNASSRQATAPPTTTADHPMPENESEPPADPPTSRSRIQPSATTNPPPPQAPSKARLSRHLCGKCLKPFTTPYNRDQHQLKCG